MAKKPEGKGQSDAEILAAYRKSTKIKTAGMEESTQEEHDKKILDAWQAVSEITVGEYKQISREKKHVWSKDRELLLWFRRSKQYDEKETEIIKTRGRIINESGIQFGTELKKGVVALISLDGKITTGEGLDSKELTSPEDFELKNE